jgi:hypothetical protein
MDAPPLSSERRRELAELRSRAYGPDADIDRDADALARLIELEELARTDAPDAVIEPVRGPGAPADAAAAGPASIAGESTAVVLGETGSPVESETATAIAPDRRPRWRRVPLWAYLSTALLVGVVIGLAMPALVPPHPATTLQQAPIDGAPLDFQMYGIQAVSPVRYQSFHDLEVWSAQTEQGSTCIVVTSDAAEWMTAGCAPAPLDPTADINFYTGMRAIDGLEMPDGSVLRFILRGDVMEVWIAETVEGA